MKPLVVDDDGAAMVMLKGSPPTDLRAALPSMPYRHYHSSVYEHIFFLSGELPHWDYRSPEDGVGELISFQSGYYLEGRPGPEGLHGIEEGPRSAVGATSVNWRSGVGNYASEPNFHEESIQVDYPPDKKTVALVPADARPDGSGIVYQSPTRTILDTRAMNWQQFPGTKGGYIKVLARDEDGCPTTLLGWLPRGTSEALRTRPDRSGKPFRENIFVLSGTLPHPDDDGGVTYLPEGSFIDRPVVPSTDWSDAASAPELAPGCTVLMWRFEYLT
jgi:hypothetical protein